MISSRRPPTFMPTTPLSQPGITCPAPSVNVKGWLVHDDWMTLPLEYVASTYWTFTLSPGAAAVPVPLMRSALSNVFGGAPAGTVTVGALPAVPTGERSAGGMGAMAIKPPPPGAVVEVAPDATEPDAFDALEVLDVFELDAPDGVDGEELHAARPSAPAAPIKSATARGWRRRKDTERESSRSPRRCPRGPTGAAAVLPTLGSSGRPGMGWGTKQKS